MKRSFPLILAAISLIDSGGKSPTLLLAGLACLVPSLRASRIDPLLALRAD